MKRIVCLLLALCLGTLALAGCGNKTYPPVKSTAEEAKTVITLTYGNRTYNVKYELYRTFFLSYREEIDGGDRSVWTGSEKESYREKINAKILGQIAEIYATEALCREIGFDQFGKDADKAVQEYIRISVEGGETSGGNIEGIGSYDEYLALLKEKYINYSVQDLIYRYYLGSEALNDYYCGQDSEFMSEFSFGSTKHTEADLREFYDGDSAIRVLWCYLPGNVYTEEKALTARDKLITARDLVTTDAEKEQKVGIAMVGLTTAAADDILNGQIVTRDNLDANLYGDIVEAAFTLGTTEISQPISVKSDQFDGYFLVYRTVKSDSFYDTHKDDVMNAFLQDALGKKIRAVKEEMISSVQFKNGLLTLDLSAVTMD